jgi:hypothetical protein
MNYLAKTTQKKVDTLCNCSFTPAKKFINVFGWYNVLLASLTSI